MYSTAWLRLALLGAVIVGTAYAASACSGSGDYVDHGFEFNAISDSPGIQIIDFKYGDGTAHGTQNPPQLVKEGRSLQRMAVYGHMPRPDSLYVRWRIASEGRTYEDTVDLRNRLPRDLAGSKVYFMIRGAQLEVYFISKEPRRPGDPVVGPSMFHHRKVVRLYPE